MRKKIINSISFRLGMLFSTIFLILLIILGYILFALFSRVFTDYIVSDLLIRGENHSTALSDRFRQSTIDHVALMEQNVATSVVVTDFNKNILSESEEIDSEKKKYIYSEQIIDGNMVLNRNWEDSKYLATVSEIEDNLGYVYMFYPTSIINEIVIVLKGFIAISSFGVILIAIGLFLVLMRKMTMPLLKMKEATNKLARGNYKQSLRIQGNDELAQLGDSINQLGEQLQYFENSRNDFLASVSHELRTPLTYIKGYSDVLLKGIIKDSEEQKKYLKIINDETKRVSHIVNDLFELSTIQAGKFTLNKEITNITALLKKVVDNLTPLAKEKKLEVFFASENNISPITIDPIRIEQVFFNLIQNAIKYTDKGHVRVRIKQDKEFVIIDVEDTGIGIPADELSLVWDRFYRVEKSRARKTGGSGLGLYVVKEIILLHGGLMDIKSQECKGTTVSIKLKRNE